MSELPRDDFSAYKRTILQEHLYQSLFKDESDEVCEFMGAQLMSDPWLLLRNGRSAHLNMQEFRLKLDDLIKEV